MSMTLNFLNKTNVENTNENCDAQRYDQGKKIMQRSYRFISSPISTIMLRQMQQENALFTTNFAT